MSDPIILDLQPQLKMTSLKEWGYLKGEQTISGSINWTHNLGWNKPKSISFYLNTISSCPYIELEYTSNDDVIKYKVDLVYKISNLGKGKVWYFVCPKTNKRCRKLHLIGKYFYHGSAFNNARYMSETLSKESRARYSDNVKLQRKFKAEDILYSKHFRSHYKGKPTKNYLQALKWIQEAEGLTEESVYYS